MNIGLTYTGSVEKHQHYVRWLKQQDDIGIITLSAETKENKGSIDDCDALVLSGGVDIHPGYYNSDNIVYPNMPQPFNQKRDAFEIGIFQTAQKRKIPVVGICRGMQLINVILGGTMQQDLGARNTVHKAMADVNKMQTDKAHGIHIQPGSLLAEIAQAELSVVNSAHHQCTDKIADALTATCLSHDDIVEGLEWKDKSGKPFLLCVQWHPERMFQYQLENSNLSAGIRNHFITSIQSSKQPV